MGSFTAKDGLALLRLLGIVSGMTIALWLPLHFLTTLSISVSDVYVISSVLLLVLHLIRLRVQAHRSRAHRD